MQPKDMVLAAGRLSVVTQKAGTEFETTLGKWFEKHFVKGLTLQLLRSMHGSGAFAAFRAFLEAGKDAPVITILGKLDPNRPEVRARSKAAMIEHVAALAASAIEPAGKPKPPPKPKKVKAKPETDGGVLERTRY